MRNILTVDVEEYYHVGRPGEGPCDDEVRFLQSRIDEDIRRVLELLRSHSARATFFVLGEVARARPRSIEIIAAEGHEIACHGFRHVPVDALSRAAFEADLDRAIEAIGEASGRRPAGYRAPIWSLSRAPWGLDALISRSFRYDSSFAPVPPLGSADLPAHATVMQRERGSILELPPLTRRLGRWRFPVGFALGLRLLPAGLVERAIERENDAGRPALVAFHPWELDPDPPALRLRPALAVAHAFGTDKLRPKLETLLDRIEWGSVQEVMRDALPNGEAA